jgi:hypothetical protein
MRTQRVQHVTWIVALGLLAGGVVWETSALAQDKAQRQRPCTADAQKLCPDARTSKEQLQCLQSHEAELSQSCRDLLARTAAARSKIVEMQEACKTDAETFCKDAKPGRGALVQCLRSHAAELSPACKGTLPKGKDKAS